MKLKQVNKLGELHVLCDGLKVEGIEDDGGIRRLVLTTDAGDYLEIGPGPYYGDAHVQVMVPAPPRMVKRWVLQGQVQDLQVHELFEAQYEAENRKNELTGHLDESRFAMSVSEEEVPE